MRACSVSSIRPVRPHRALLPRASSPRSTSRGRSPGPDEPIATLSDLAKLTFQVDVPLKTVRKPRHGMAGYVTGPGLPGRITTTLRRVEPKVDTQPAEPRVIRAPAAE